MFIDIVLVTIAISLLSVLIILAREKFHKQQRDLQYAYSVFTKDVLSTEMIIKAQQIYFTLGPIKQTKFLKRIEKLKNNIGKNIMVEANNIANEEHYFLVNISLYLKDKNFIDAIKKLGYGMEIDDEGADFVPHLLYNNIKNNHINTTEEDSSLKSERLSKLFLSSLFLKLKF